jgi:EmrB/QacA subfamily drug resistance transporter
MTTTTTTTATSDRGTGNWRVLLAMGLASGITSVPNAALPLALPTLHREFDTSITVLQWTITGYLLAYASLMIAAGRLADIYGRKRVLMVGTALFMAGSVPGALTHDAIVLIASLIVAGIGAAVLTPASLAIITDAFRGERRGLAVGVWGAATALFSGLAPAIGGLATGEFSWRWLLWLNVIVGAAVLIGALSVRETRDEEAQRGSLDWIGLVCSVGALAGVTLALNETPTQWSWSSPQTIVVLALAVALFVAFVLVEPRRRAPLIDLAMFAKRNLSGACLSLLVLNFALGAVLYFVPLYLMQLLDYTPLQGGLLLLPSSAGMMITMPIGGRLSDRYGPVWPIVGGMGLTAVATLLLAGIDARTSYRDLWIPLTLLGIGIGLALTPLNLAALGAVPQRLHAAVGGVLSTIGGVGLTLGVAGSGALFESLQSNRTSADAAKAGITLSHGAATSLEGLLAGTPSAAKTLASFPAEQHATLHAAVRDGFLSALGTTMALSFGVVVVGIALTLALVRRQPAVDA